MPTYQYVCTECSGRLEVVQKFTDDALTVHEECGGKLRKVFSPVGIVFKGSGFYRTDSRSGSSSSSASTGNGSSGDSSATPSAAKAGSDSSGSPSSSSSSSESSSSSSSAATSSSSSSGSSGEKVA